MSNFEERIQSSLRDFDLGARSLLKRSNSMAELARSDKRLGHIRRVVERFGGFLGDALKVLEPELADGPIPGGERQVLESIDKESIALDCAQSMIRDLSSPNDRPAAATDSTRGMEGNSRAVPIPELLSFFSSVRKSGTLQISTSGETFTLVLVDGVVQSAQSDNSPPGTRLGDILVARGSLTETELGKFLKKKRKKRSRKLGGALVTKGLVSGEDIAMALREQIRQLFFRMYSIDDATFVFYDGACPTEEYSVRMDVSGLLLQSAVERDERESA